MKKTLFRCHRLGDLISGNIGLTNNQKEELKQFQDRFDGIGKPLTESMIIKYGDLLQKQKESKSGEITEGAKSFVIDTFLSNELGYREDLMTDELIKGLTLESDAISLLSETLPIKGLRMKNKEYYTNDWIIGTPDLILPDAIEDIKVSSNIRTFFKSTLTKQYEWQLKGYCMLLGLSKARLVYCCLPDTEEMILQREKKYFFKFDCNEENEDYIEICKQIRANQEAVLKLPKEKRIKVFDVEFTSEDAEKIKLSVEKCRIFYDKLCEDILLTNLESI